MARSLLVASLLLASSVAAGSGSAWSRVSSVAPGPAQSIGGYSAGCLRGGKPLPQQGPGFRVMRPERGRHYGHPHLIEFIGILGASLSEAALAPLAVGDLGQPRGGPAPSGHASHQTGLDVDLWFSPGDSGQQHSMVAEGKNQVSKHYGPRTEKLLRLAAGDQRVARIFVNPVIKRQLCQSSGKNRKWLRKLRPWWGHDEHFHVRLTCPAESSQCRNQAPVPAGDGCGELDWWLDARKKKARDQGVRKYAKRIRSKPKLPEACQAVLKTRGPG